jgi:hypothetical protein
MAAALDWPEQRLRSVLNQLVKSKLLSYKRRFRLPGDPQA